MRNGPVPDEPDAMMRHVKMDRRGGIWAKLDPVEWWYWFQGKRLDRFYARSHAPEVRPRLTPAESARVGTEMMLKARGFRK